MINIRINQDDKVEFLGSLTEFRGTEVLNNIKRIAGIQQCEDDEEDLTFEEKPLSNLPQSSQKEITSND